MPNTRWKGREMPRHRHIGNYAPYLSWPAPLLGAPVKQAGQAQDMVPVCRRVLLSTNTGLGDHWLVSDDPAGNPQTHPEVGVWRTVATSRARLAPGSQLSLRVLAVRSGMSEYFSIPMSATWVPYGVQGRVRVVVD